MLEGPALVSIRDRLLKERHALLDLSTRNRLLNTPLRTKNNRAIEIVDESAEEVFRLLTANKTLSFLPGIQLSDEERAKLDPDDDVTGGIPQPEDSSVNEQGIASRHADSRLQTRLTSEGLQRRLFDIWYDAQTLEQEQGVNILYLAIGLLRWFDSDSSDLARHAPLILLPVKLERTSAADKFKLRWREEAPSPNLTLQAKMKVEFALSIEGFNDEDEVDIAGYFARVASTVSLKSRWKVLPNAMVLGFFSFSKFLMYRDLDPDNWPQDAGIDTHKAVCALLRDGFSQSVPLIPDDASIDDFIRPIETHHVVDADSSQSVAIAETAAGRSMVIKGPPGTGKSQTITNIIAASVARGKKVLFVAEKMAALDVVHRRLRQVGLGPLTLELHSNKVNKRTVLEELKRTRDGQYKSARGDITVVERLSAARDSLNGFAKRLHCPLTPSGLTPQAILGRLGRLQAFPTTNFHLVGAETWGQAAVATRREVIQDVAERLGKLGPVTSHVWRGVGCGAIDPVERRALGDDIALLADALRLISVQSQVAADALGASLPRAIGDLPRVLAFLGMTPLPANVDRAVLADDRWRDMDGLRRLVNAGAAYEAAEKKLSPLFNDIGINARYDAIRAAVVTKGKSILRFLSRDYRNQIALLRSYLKVPLPKSQSERLDLIDQMIGAQKVKAVFEALESAGRAFGSAWKGARSEWDSLGAILNWRAAHVELPVSAWEALASLEDVGAVEAAREELERRLPDVEALLGRLVKKLSLDLRRAFSVSETSAVPLASLSDRLEAWSKDMEGLSHFILFASRARLLAELGGASLVEAIYDGLLNEKTLSEAFECGYAEVLRVALFSTWPELRGFDGEEHNNLVSQFRGLDKLRIELAQEQIVSAHAAGRPSGAAGIGPLGVLNAEIAKKRGHLPIRTLLDKAGPAIQQLKPVFMMSPLSVAQFLRPGGLHFDLLVMDEASQIEPVDSLGAIARADQIVVVGDERQLPPTAFFKKLTGEEDSEETDDNITLQAKDAESILDLCLAKGLPHRMLNWHYRSKHQSLIAVSNREFYENKLFIVPSPYDAVSAMGLKFNHLEDTAYDRGETRTNPREAKAVAEAVIRHARANPAQTLGVATFSVAQRQAILKELELLRRATPELEEFFSSARHEPFFVKNLENIQGDERDVIFVSVGYGKTREGYLAHAFGPLSGEGGERRLNVLISRAKMRCEVFCNFTGADLDLERTRSRGVAAFKLFLTFAETGNFGLGEVTRDDFDSEFELQVYERLRSLGYDVKRQIGASGFRVGLAISDSEAPGRFVLGIECDGAQYHSSRSARDRDRLRQQVLEAHGWIIHRVWSADWYLRPEAELKKIEAAVVAAEAEWAARDEERVQAGSLRMSFQGEIHDNEEIVTATVDAPSQPTATNIAYAEAAFPVNHGVEPHEAPLADMTAYVVKIVELEGPIHFDEIVARVRGLWGLGRAGSRIRAAVERAVQAATNRSLIDGGPFYQLPGQKVIVRDRSVVTSTTLRRPEMLPPVEIDEAIIQIVDDNFGAQREEIVTAVSRLLGYAATSAQLRSVLIAGVERLTEAGVLIAKNELLVRTKAAVA